MKPIIPPYQVVPDFLAEEAVAGLLDFALAHTTDFKPAALFDGVVDATRRISLSTRDLGPSRDLIKTRIMEALPDLCTTLGVPQPPCPKVELELVAHGDGAFFKRHSDTRRVGSSRQAPVRVVSGVYYFHTAPKAFSGGHLRLFAIGDPGKSVDIEPTHNTLVTFPSWVPHEVTAVSCPSGRFADSRFAINCWVWREHAPAGA